MPRLKGVLPLGERLAYSVEEVGKLLGIGKSLAYEAVRSGTIPSIRLGKEGGQRGRFIIPKEALRKLLESEGLEFPLNST